MTLPNKNLSLYSEQLCCAHDNSSNWDPLYSSQIWSNSNLRKAIINAPYKSRSGIKYCYTCRGKIRNYQIESSNCDFLPGNHSTPKGNPCSTHIESYRQSNDMSFLELADNRIPKPHSGLTIPDIDVSNVEISQNVPTISEQIDSNFRNKYAMSGINRQSLVGGRHRIRKSLRCLVNFALTDSPKKKRTQIQACSISLMIVAIVVISLILVNFTSTNFINSFNSTSTTVVPTKSVAINETTSAIVNVNQASTSLRVTIDLIDSTTTTEEPLIATSQNYTEINNIIAKLRNNIKTYLKNSNNNEEVKKSNIINRDLTQKFCSCQTNQICMLNETSGTSICKTAVDVDDPTGCGGLCALETEACHLVDRSHGARVCRQINPVTCSPHQWRCRNGLCVASESRCDGFIQCYDRSDELNCECDLKTHFRCGRLMSCFPNKKICDGVVDCWDGYDEVNCTRDCIHPMLNKTVNEVKEVNVKMGGPQAPPYNTGQQSYRDLPPDREPINATSKNYLKCPKNQFTCNDGQCIPSQRFCDGVMDCDDGSDEPSGCDSCGVHEVRCNNKRCITSLFRCNGRNDCEDNTDELNCP